jgi:proteasome lid subunit RPN8/RPN11
MKVRLRKSQLDKFRKLARCNKNEIYAYLIGTIDTSTQVTIKRIEYPELEESTPGGVRPEYDSWEDIDQKARADGDMIVGAIHSHPNWWPVMSPSDHKAHIVDNFRVSAICAVMNNRTKVYFWTSDSALPCKTEFM